MPVRFSAFVIWVPIGSQAGSTVQTWHSYIGVLLKDFNEGDIGVLWCAILVGILLVLGAAGCYAGFIALRSRTRKRSSFLLCHSKT